MTNRYEDGQKPHERQQAHKLQFGLLFYIQADVGRLTCPNVSLQEEALSHFSPSRTESVDYFRHRGLFDQTPTTLHSFLTSLTSNVWHSRLAADQLSTPRQGPTGPGKMPLHVGPDHMRVGPDWGPQRAAPPTYTASQSLKINSRKDIRGHQEQGGGSSLLKSGENEAL